MKKYLLLFLFAICFIAVKAETTNDSINTPAITTIPVSQVGSYKLFPTTNMWTFIKLDTRNGKLWQVQYDVEGDSRGSWVINPDSKVYDDNEVNGRFTLYPTQNSYNFLLLDQISGVIWQIQWSMQDENRGIIDVIF